MQRRDNVFITGPTGVIGSALAQELRGRNVTCLVHRDPTLPRHVSRLRGDVCAPRLGLSKADYHDLARRTTHVAHCAWHADFGMAPEEIETINLLATRQVLEFAAAAKARVLYMSSAFVSPGHGAEARLTALTRQPGPWEGVLAYVHFKRLCEKLVTDSGLPATIARPSIVMGHSRTGQIARFQGAQILIGLLFKHQAPLVPAPADTIIDFLPQDLVARALVRLLELHEPRPVCMLTAGTHAVALQRLVDLTVDFASGAGYAVDRPTLIEADAVKQEVLDSLPSKTRRRFELMRALLCLYQRQQPFPDPIDELDLSDWSDLGLERVYTATLTYWGRKQGLVDGEAS